MRNLRKRTWRPPPLKTRVWLRNPGDKPAILKTRYGADLTSPDLASGWGEIVRAARDDRQVQARNEKGQTFRVRRTVWTIRDRPGVAPNCEIIADGLTYRSIGPAVGRGGPGNGRRSRYLEIHCELTQ